MCSAVLLEKTLNTVTVVIVKLTVVIEIVVIGGANCNYWDSGDRGAYCS